MEPLRIADKQLLSFRESQAHINIWEGSVRSGKTWATLFRWIDYIINGPQTGDLAVIGKTSGTLERNIIKDLQYLVGGDLTYLKGSNPRLKLWGRTMWLLGANDERAYQKILGATLAGILGDELTTWTESLFEMSLSRLSVEGAKFFGTTNPDGPAHWLKKNWLDRKEEIDLKSWAFRLEDNPFLAVGFVENLKKQYTGLWRKRYIEGLWCLAEGAVYDFWDEALHVIDRIPVAEYYIVGVDYGTGNPTAYVLIGINSVSKPRIWAEKEYYWDPKKTLRQKTDAEFSRDLKQFLESRSLPTAPVVAIYVDPSAASLKLQFKRDGIVGVKDADNSVIDGIRTVARLTVNGDYKITRGCRQLIEDKSNYVWNERKAKVGEDEPLKQNDHSQDAERYALHTHFGSEGAVLNYNTLL